MRPDVERPRAVRSRGSRIRVRLVGEALKPSGMSRVGAPSVGNQMGAHPAVGEVHQVKSRCSRGKGEVRDADEVPIADAVVMSLESIERTPQQTGIHPAVSTFCPSESPASSRGPGSQAGNRKIDKKTSGNYQDDELRRH